MTVLEDRRRTTPGGALASAARSVPATPARTRRPRVSGVRPRELALRRPGGRFVDYGAAPAPSVAAGPARPHCCPPAAGRGGRQAPSAALIRLRVLLALLAVGIVLVGAGAGLTRLVAGQGDGVPVSTAVVQVRQGENLSAVAARVAPAASTSAVVRKIVELNGLSTVSVRSGQALVVPVSS